MNNKYFKISIISCVIINICFIWGNTLVPGSKSGNISLEIMNSFNTFLSNIGVNFQVTNFMVRKAAHFTEHMVLGFFLLFMLRSYTKNIFSNILNILFIGLFVPVVDEFTQLFIEGRGGEIRDVVIDFSGILTGIIIAFIIVYIIDLKNNNSLKIKYKK